MTHEGRADDVAGPPDAALDDWGDLLADAGLVVFSSPDLVIFSSQVGPSPLDICTPRQFRRALGRVYTRDEADRIWRTQVTYGLARSMGEWDEDHLLPVALLSPLLRARIRARSGWSRREMNVRLSRWCREIVGRPGVREGVSADELCSRRRARRTR